jgi:hypothetical protein
MSMLTELRFNVGRLESKSAQIMSVLDDKKPQNIPSHIVRDSQKALALINEAMNDLYGICYQKDRQ